MRPFSLDDPHISFPYIKETVSVPVAFVSCFVIPGAIIFVICVLLVPGPTVPKRVPSALKIRRKLWELHTSLLGLALAVAAAFCITNGMPSTFN
jgi:hypothetical protein